MAGNVEAFILPLHATPRPLTMATSASPRQQQADATGNEPPSNNANARAPGRPTVRIHFSSNGSSNLTTPSVRVTNQNPSNGNMRRIAMPPIAPPPPLPPLEPQPQPHSRAHNEDNDPSLKKFECAICFEYLNQPVGCGSSSCPYRFCKKCLQRTVLQDLQRSSASNPQQQPTAKCPHCRTVILPSSIRGDHTLQAEMNSCTSPITCPFDGCNAELTLKDLEQHEKSCPHLPIQCRYAPYGCTWNGALCSFPDHELECHFTSWNVLIDNIRKHQWETKHILHQYQGFMNLNHAFIHSNRQLILAHHNNCAGNTWYILQMMLEAAMFPGRFIHNGGLWNVTNEHERAMILNQVVMWPILGVVARVAAMGVQHVPRLVHLMLENGDDTTDEMWGLVEMMMLSLAVTVMGILAVACLYADSGNPLSWGRYDIASSILGDQPWIRDIAACSVAMIVFTFMELYGSIRGGMIWIFVASLSLVTTSFVEGMTGKLLERAPRVVLLQSRNTAIVEFGLRYGFAIYTCGFLPAVGGMLILRMLPLTVKRKIHMILDSPGTDCFLTNISSSHAVVAMIAYLAAAASMYQEQIMQPIMQVLTAICVLVIINLYLLYLIVKVGAKLVETNCNNEGAVNNATLLASGAPITLQKPSPVGACAAAAFVLTSVLIATI